MELFASSNWSATSWHLWILPWNRRQNVHKTMCPPKQPFPVWYSNKQMQQYLCKLVHHSYFVLYSMLRNMFRSNGVLHLTQSVQDVLLVVNLKQQEELCCLLKLLCALAPSNILDVSTKKWMRLMRENSQFAECCSGCYAHQANSPSEANCSLTQRKGRRRDVITWPVTWGGFCTTKTRHDTYMTL